MGCRERPPGPAPSDSLSWQEKRSQARGGCRALCHYEVTEDIREWDYGDYEGKTSAQIKEERARQFGGDGSWDIWKDGCPGGESPEQVTERLDTLIAEIRSKFHGPAMGKTGDGPPPDVLLVAHGHILRAFAMRWIGRNLHDNPSMLLEAGGVGTLR